VRIVLDTNVFISGVFFRGAPARILEAWRDGKVQLVASAEILGEYQRVGRELAAKYEGVDLEPFLALLAMEAEIIRAPKLLESVCDDPDDDKFLACAVASGVGVVVSGDKALRRVSGYAGVIVSSPRQFVDREL